MRYIIYATNRPAVSKAMGLVRVAEPVQLVLVAPLPRIHVVFQQHLVQHNNTIELNCMYVSE